MRKLYRNGELISLLKNHFHLLIRTHSEEYLKSKEGLFKEGKDVFWVLNNAFASFFKSYAQSVNKVYQRTGRLFEEPFRRIHIDSDAYFTQMVYYIHHNPQKHGFVPDFKEYLHSSYHSHLLTANTKLKREEVISWFGNPKEYEKFHSGEHFPRNLNKFDIEF